MNRGGQERKGRTSRNLLLGDTIQHNPHRIRIVIPSFLRVIYLPHCCCSSSSQQRLIIHPPALALPSRPNSSASLPFTLGVFPEGLWGVLRDLEKMQQEIVFEYRRG